METSVELHSAEPMTGSDLVSLRKGVLEPEP